jgi:hypothetical protein
VLSPRWDVTSLGIGRNNLEGLMVRREVERAEANDADRNSGGSAIALVVCTDFGMDQLTFVIF